jgi:hypothetical protein
MFAVLHSCGKYNESGRIKGVRTYLRKGYVVDGIGYIPLTQGQVACVDAADVPMLEQDNWYADWNSGLGGFYAARTGPMINGKHGQKIYMHAVILGLEPGGELEADHEDHNTLNNRRYNLRPANRNQTLINQRKRKDNTSGYKGVCYHKQARKWYARIYVNGVCRSLGLFPTAAEAFEAYRKASIENHGEFSIFK